MKEGVVSKPSSWALSSRQHKVTVLEAWEGYTCYSVVVL